MKTIMEQTGNENVVELSEIYKAMAHPSRVAITLLLSKRTDKRMTVQCLYNELKLAQPVISRHLGILKNAGLVHRFIENSRTFYMLNENNKHIQQVIIGRAPKNLPLHETLDKERQKHIKELEEILQMLSHGVTSPLCSCLGLIELLDANAKTPYTDKELKKIINGIKTNTIQMGDVTKDLSSHMYKSVLKYKGRA